MSQISIRRVLLAIVGCAALGMMYGCGNSNSAATLNAESGKHPADWMPSQHATAALANIDSCAACHGEDFKGGIAGRSCDKCHLGSESVHPDQWGSFAYARHKVFVAAQGTTSCATAECHGATLAGVTGPACATACHMTSATVNHPPSWANFAGTSSNLGHAEYVRANGFAQCSTTACHGTLAKGVFLSGPSCYVCHPADPLAVGPVPDKHPNNLLVNGIFENTHGPYVITNGSRSCMTAICHGGAGRGPACSKCHQ